MAGVPSITFHTRSGYLTIISEPGASESEFPKYRMVFPVEMTSEIPETVQASARKIFSTEAKVCRGGPDLLVVVGSWETVRACSPDSKLLEVLLRQNGLRGAILTAAIAPDEGPPPGESELSFVSRFFRALSSSIFGTYALCWSSLECISLQTFALDFYVALASTMKTTTTTSLLLPLLLLL